MGAGIRRHPCGVLVWYEMIRVFERTRIGEELFFVSASIWKSRDFLGQIASFDHRLRGAAPSPLTLPHPFRTWPGTGMEAERDKREVNAQKFVL